MAASPTYTWDHSDTGTNRAFLTLYLGYILLPVLAGADKFFYAFTDWTQYLAPQIPQTLGISAFTLMQIIGVVEIVAGFLVMIAPRIGGYVLMLWLWGIIGNLVLRGGFNDIALRDFGLSLGALALASLATYEKHEERVSS